jgi:enoyl-CoA hydratase/carnithine racemase
MTAMDTAAGAGGVLRVEDDRRVRLVTFHRPAVLNAFDTALYTAAAQALDGAAADDGVGAVVLTGAGRAFSSGQDLGEMAALAARVSEQRTGGNGEGVGAAVSAFPRFVDAIEAFPKPLLAAVNGLGLGIGFTMLAHCDLVLVAEGARLKTPFTELGVAPEAASSYLFPRRMGWQRAAKVLLSSGWVGAEELVACGLALEVVPAGEVVERTLDLARAIAARPLASLVATKRLMLDAQLPGVRGARQREDAAFAELLGAGANRAALDAFGDLGAGGYLAGEDSRPGEYG